MAERDAFLRAIRQSPDDDAPRLVFADWLDEHGDAARAEFIRTQCALAADPYRPDRVRLRRRERELSPHRAAWIAEDGLTERINAEYLDSRHYPWWIARFHRGFVEGVTFHSPDACRSAIADLATRTPLQGVELCSPYTFTREQEASARNTSYRRSYERVRREHGDFWAAHLEQYADADPELPEPDEFRQFAFDPHVGRLRSFRIQSLYFDPRILRLFLNSPLAANLRHLDLSEHHLLRGEDWRLLGESPSLAGLESLTLNECDLERDGFAALQQSPHWQNLRTLTMRGSDRLHVGSLVIQAIVNATMPRLEELELHGQHVGEAGLTALANWPGLRRLQRLGIGYNFSDEGGDDLGAGLQRLLASPHWGELRELDVSETVCDLERLEMLAASPNLSTLRVLWLLRADSAEGEPPLGKQAARMLAACPYLGDGVEIHFDRDRLTPIAQDELRERFGEGLWLHPS